MILIGSLAAMIAPAYFLLMDVELRKDNMKGFWLLVLSSAGLAGFCAWFAAWTNWPFVVCKLMAVSCAAGGVFFGAWMSKTSTNREYLTRNLILGACVGFGGFLVLMWLTTKAFVFKGKGEIWVMVVLAFILCSLYLGYVLIYIILPGTQDGEDWVNAVLRVYVHIGIIVSVFVAILISLCKKKD